MSSQYVSSNNCSLRVSQELVIDDILICLCDSSSFSTLARAELLVGEDVVCRHVEILLQDVGFIYGGTCPVFHVHH